MHNDIIYSLKDEEVGRDRRFYKDKIETWSQKVEGVMRRSVIANKRNTQMQNSMKELQDMVIRLKGIKKFTIMYYFSC